MLIRIRHECIVVYVYGVTNRYVVTYIYCGMVHAVHTFLVSVIF